MMDEEGQASRARAAARWYAELQSPEVTAETWDAFREWEGDPRNAAAFRKVEAAMSVLDRSSLAAAAAPRTSRRRWVAWTGGLAASAALALLATFALGDPVGPGPAPPEVQDYVTVVGEQRTVSLPDGSSVVLDTGTRMEVAYAAPERLVRLAEGRALFEVKSGAAPFVVEAAGTRTRALGTTFGVQVKPKGAEVTLVEGSVSVAPAGQPGVVLSPGERLSINDGKAGSAVAVDLAAELAWRTGILQFKDTRLADAAEELNRYSATKILIDPRLADERLSGSFRAGDQDMFVAALVSFLPVESRRSEDAILVVPAGG